MSAFWTVTQWELTSPLTPLEIERRLRATLNARRQTRPRIAGTVSERGVVAWVKPLSVRADLHPRLILTLTPAANGSRLVCQIAPRRWGLLFNLVLLALLGAVALFFLAVWLEPQLDLRARKPGEAFVVFSIATIFGACLFALLLWANRSDRAILTDFVRSALETPD